MTCRDIDEILIASAGGDLLPERAREHVQTCPNCRALVSAGKNGEASTLEPAVLDRIRATILSTLAPVRPLAGAPVFAAAFLIIVAAIAAGGAALLGMRGVPLMMPLHRAAVFGVLLASAVLAAFATARSMRPAARTVSGGVVSAAAILAIEIVFLSLFHDLSMRRFLPSGVACLCAGLACAIPAGLLMWLLVRRGFVVAPASTGASAGALAGVTGLAMLELHCPNLTLPHVAVWHAAVLAIAIAMGAAIGWGSKLNVR